MYRVMPNKLGKVTGRDQTSNYYRTFFPASLSGSNKSGALSYDKELSVPPIFLLCVLQSASALDPIRHGRVDSP